jgi:predicted dehydrogenase
MGEKIRWGILGTAAHARKALIPAIKASSNGEVFAVASRDWEKAKNFAAENGIPRAFGSYEELLASPEIDAVYNPLPVSMHAEWSVRCAEAGKPVLCEKPIALNAAETERMIRVFEEKKLLLMEGIMYHYHPLTRRAVQMAREGAVGKIQMVYAQFNAKIGNPDDIRFKKEMGGGALLDVGCYCASVLRLLAGEEPVAVRAGSRFSDSGVDVVSCGVLSFPSGVQGHLGCSLTAQFNCEYGVSGTEGRLLVDHGAMCAWPGESFKIRWWHGGAYEEIAVPPANHYQLMVEDFAAALFENRPAAIHPRESLNNMRVLDQLAASARQACFGPKEAPRF